MLSTSKNKLINCIRGAAVLATCVGGATGWAALQSHNQETSAGYGIGLNPENAKERFPQEYAQIRDVLMPCYFSEYPEHLREKLFQTHLNNTRTLASAERLAGGYDDRYPWTENISLVSAQMGSFGVLQIKPKTAVEVYEAHLKHLRGSSMFAQPISVAELRGFLAEGRQDRVVEILDLTNVGGLTLGLMHWTDRFLENYRYLDARLGKDTKDEPLKAEVREQVAKRSRSLGKILKERPQNLFQSLRIQVGLERDENIDRRAFLRRIGQTDYSNPRLTSRITALTGILNDAAWLDGTSRIPNIGRFGPQTQRALIRYLSKSDPERFPPGEAKAWMEKYSSDPDFMLDTVRELWFKAHSSGDSYEDQFRKKWQKIIWLAGSGSETRRAAAAALARDYFYPERDPVPQGEKGDIYEKVPASALTALCSAVSTFKLRALVPSSPEWLKRQAQSEALVNDLINNRGSAILYSLTPEAFSDGEEVNRADYQQFFKLLAEHVYRDRTPAMFLEMGNTCRQGTALDGDTKTLQRSLYAANLPVTADTYQAVTDDGHR